MNPFAALATELVRSNRQGWATPEAQEKPKSRTGTIRELLKSSDRPMTAFEIAMDVDLPSFTSHLVWLLLKHNIKLGRVIFVDNKYSYNHAWDTDLAASLRDAEKLLRKHSYAVAAPKAVKA